MALVEAKCTNCGSKLEIDNAKDAAICPVCNSPFIVEKAIKNIENETTINNSTVNIYQSSSFSVDNGCYEGDIKSGKPHGYGICEYRDGSKYEGNWLAGVRSGKGTIYYEDGKSWSGEWKNDYEYTGEGIVYFDGSVYEGTLKNGDRNGQGTEFYDDGRKWSGIWKDNVEWTGEGDVVFYDDYNKPTGQVFIGKLTDGIYDYNGEWHFNGDRFWNGMEIKNDVLLSYIGSEEILDIPEGVRRINDIWIPTIKSLKLPSTIETISKDYFSGYDNVERIEGSNVKEIPDHMFECWPNIKTAIFPNATIVGVSAFAGCLKLSYVDIPSVKLIKSKVFIFCNLSKKFNVPSVETIEEGGCSGGVFSPQQQVMLKKLHAPNLRFIGNEAFARNFELEEIFIPSLEHIGYRAFEGCEKLKKIEGQNINFIERFAFSSCKQLTHVVCPNAILDFDGKEYNQFFGCDVLETIQISESVDKAKIVKTSADRSRNSNKSNGCYVATAVYGSYDCPQVWVLRRYRDFSLAKTWHGRVFIKTYYVISPTIVRWFGNTKWFKKLWRGKLDRIVANLQSEGVESTPYEDRKWWI